MRVSTTWLNAYLKKSLSTDEIVEALEKTEVEIEEVIQSPQLDKKIITSRVLNVIKHPNADKLHLVDIELGKSKARVVCGAPNVRAGLVVAYAQPGSILPDGMEITSREIRGEKSTGMLASAKELGLSEDHAGIIELDPGLPLGISLCDIDNMGDVLDVKTPANRWDMLSVLGLAREIAANSSNNQVIEPKRPEITYENREVVKVKEIGECKRFVSGVVKIDNTLSTPAWIVENLQAAGMRSINPIVDISNFVMLETGQPSHAYDAQKIKGSLQVRFAKSSETLTTLDGVSRKLSKEDLIIADSSGPVGLAGVMGGASTEVDESTTEIILEVANFNKTTIRRMALRHGLRSEASGRFEKGLPLPLPRYGFERAIQLLEDICKGKIENRPNDQLYGWPWIQHVGLGLRKAEAILGVKLDEKQIIEGLKARGFEAEHFSITKEARKHLGKPYVWGASFKKNGSDAFDCGYFVDYVYSLIGQMVGHQCLELFESGTEINVEDLKPGDAVFRDGPWEKLKREDRKGLSHIALYIGNGKIIHARDTIRNSKGKWEKLPQDQQMVVEESIEVITKDPDFRGARRYISSLNHIIAVTAPWWRTDIKSDVDLIEEAAKIVGYDNLPNTLPELPPMETSSHQMLPSLMKLREDLVAAGLFEVMTYSFVSEKDLERTNIDTTKVLSIENPMSTEQAYLRNSLFSSHLQVAARNNSYYEELYGYFELARIYNKNKKSDTLADEGWRLAVTVCGKNGLTRVKRVFDLLNQRYQLCLQYKRGNNDLLVLGRQATLQSEKIADINGEYGQVQPMVLDSFSIENEVSYGEIVLEPSIFCESPLKSQATLPYQLVSRDLTIEFNRDVLWQNIEKVFALQKNVTRVKFIDEFIDSTLEATNTKRISLRLWLDCGAQPKQEDIATLVEQIQHSAIQQITK